MADPETASIESDPRFEERFKAESRDLLVARTRYTIAFSVFTYLGFWILDRVAAPEFALEFLSIRLCVAAFLLLVVAAFMHPLGRRAARPLSVASVFMAGLGICIMIPFMGGFASDYYVGVMLILFIAGLIFPWNAVDTLLCGTAILVCYFALNLSFAYESITRPYMIVGPAFFLTACVMFAAFGNHSSTKSRRKDLAMRMRIEAAAEELKELDEAKTRFFSNVSHELRTPLTLILGPLESIRAGREKGDLRPLLDSMDSNARRLLRQVNTLLDFAKIDAGKLKLDMGSNNLGVVIRELVDAAVPHAERKGIALTRNGCDELPDSTFDLQKAETAAANLISNALKFTPSGKSVTVNVGSTEQEIWFEVADTGAGIPEDQVAGIFNRFQQVDDSNTRKAEGTGLGLAMVKELVELHRGTITVKSVYGEGTTFKVVMPKHPVVDESRRKSPDGQAVSDTPVPGKPAPSMGRDASQRQTLLADLAGGAMAPTIGTNAPVTEDAPSLTLDGSADVEPEELPADAATLLIVEDNPDLRAFEARSLGRIYHVHTAEDGVLGFEAAQRVNPDLIISDVMMPRMNGHELCKKVRADNTLKHIPFLLVTANSGAEAVVEGLEVGADDYVTKPFEMRELEARVAAHLRARRLERSLHERDSRLSAIGQMTSAIVHDLSNPVQSVIGSVQLAQLFASDSENDELVDQLRYVVDDAMRITRMINEVLDYAKGGTTQLRTRPTNLRQWIDKIADPLVRSLEGMGIELVIEHRADEDVTLSIDADRMQRVVENLVKNARQAIMQHREPGEEHHIYLQTRSSEDSIAIRVADDGPGIPDAVAGKVFEAFETSGKEDGTGLGLSTVRNLTVAHGGDVHVESHAPEGGAAFVLAFPVKVAEQPDSAGAPSPEPGPPVH